MVSSPWFPRSYPKGKTVENVKTSNLGKILKEKNKRNEKEHVKKDIYDNPKKYKIINFKNKKNKIKLNLSIDKKKDLQNMQRIWEPDYLVIKDDVQYVYNY